MKKKYTFIGLDIANKSTGVAKLEIFEEPTEEGHLSCLSSIAVPGNSSIRPGSREMESFINIVSKWVNTDKPPDLIAYEDAMYSSGNFSGIMLALYGAPLLHALWMKGSPLLRVSISKLRYVISPGKKMDRAEWPKLLGDLEAKFKQDPAFFVYPIEGAQRAREDQSVARAAALVAYQFFMAKKDSDLTSEAHLRPFNHIINDDTEDKRKRKAGLIHRPDFYHEL